MINEMITQVFDRIEIVVVFINFMIKKRQIG